MTNNNTEQRLFRRPLTWIILAVAAVVVVVSLVLTFTQHPASSVAQPQPLPGSSSTPGSTPPSDSPVSTPSPTPSPSATSPVPRGAAPVPLTAKPSIAAKLTLHIDKLKAVKGTATGQGDVAGPSIQVTLSVHNGTAKSISFATTVVSLYYTDKLTPGLSLPGPGGKPFSGSLKPGATATGVYVFSVPVNSRKLVTITFDYSTSHPVVVFQGSGPTP